MKFDPEDGKMFGPHCRNCHKGSSACGTCHGINGLQGSVPSGWTASYARFTTNTATAIQDMPEWTTLDAALTTTNSSNEVAATVQSGFFKKSRSNTWDIYTGSDGLNWRQSTSAITQATAANTLCSDNGFSWPHRTLGWKMLKDDLFGLDIDGDAVAVGVARDSSVGGAMAHDIDSVCLDCHNPTIWNASSSSDHTDDPLDPNDNYDNELLLRGLP